MVDNRRRSVLKVGGTVFGSGVLGRKTESTSAPRRFLLHVGDTSLSEIEDAGLEIVHDLRSMGCVAVRGTKTDVKRTGVAYLTDPPLRRKRSPPATEPSAGGQRDETCYDLQWDKKAQRIEEAHEITQGDGTRVAVVDDGVHSDNPDLTDVVDLSLSKNFTGDEYGVGKAYTGNHGTAIAGIIAATQSEYLLGTAPQTEIVDCRVYSPDYIGASAGDYLAALQYSADIGCDVANLSTGPELELPDRILLLTRLAAFETAKYAQERDMLITYASGNDGIDLRKKPFTDFFERPNVLVVTATRPRGYGWPLRKQNDSNCGVGELEDPIELLQPPYTRASYSNYGLDIINISAPGGETYLPAAKQQIPGYFLDDLPVSYSRYNLDTDFPPESGIVWQDGTSYAAPQVAGAVALVKSVNPNFSFRETRSLLEKTARTVGPRSFYGAGFLDPYAAVEESASRPRQIRFSE